jgi:hypothetical protein
MKKFVLALALAFAVLGSVAPGTVPVAYACETSPCQ